MNRLLTMYVVILCAVLGASGAAAQEPVAPGDTTGGADIRR